MAKDYEFYEKQLTAITKGAGINFLGTMSGKAIILLFTLLIARVLGPKSVGLYFLGLSVVDLAIIPALLGLDSGIVRYVALFRGERNENRVKGTVISSLLIALPVSLIVAGALFFLADKISAIVFHKPALTNVLKILSLSIPFLTVSTLLLATTQALKHMQYKVYAKDLGDSIFKIAFTLVFFIVGWKLYGAVTATVISSILVAAFSLYYANKFIPLSKNALQPSLEFKNILSFSIPQTFSSLTLFGIVYTDILMLGYFLSAKDVGVFSIAAKIALLSTLILSSFNTIFAPMISDLYNQKEALLLSNLFVTVTKWIFSLSLPLFLITIFLSKPILSIFGNEFVAGSVALIILSFGQLVNSATGPVGLLIVMSGRPLLELFTNVAVFVLNICLNYFLIPKYGVLGAAVATTISISVVNLIRLGMVLLIMKIHPYKLSYLKPLFAGISSSLLVFLGFRLILAGSPIFLLLLMGPTFLIIYIALLLLFGIEREDRLVVQAIRRKLAFLIPIFNRLH